MSACRKLTGCVSLKVIRVSDLTDLKVHLESVFRDFLLRKMAGHSIRQAPIGPCLASHAKKTR